MTDRLLHVDGLLVTIPGRGGPGRDGSVEAVRDVGFDMGRERLAIVGESGSGKSMTARALVGLVPRRAKVEATSLRILGKELQHAPERQWRRMRGRHIAMIPQDPHTALHPVVKIGRQILEMHRLHGTGRATSRMRDDGLAMLEALRVPDPDRVWNAYAHELSGGMAQRVMIAMMLSAKPRVLIADEPTSALDASVAGTVLDLLDSQIRQRGMGLILISHDLRMVHRYADRTLVMYRGEIVERLETAGLHDVRHPYTQGLLRSVPSILRPVHRLPEIDREVAWSR